MIINACYSAKMAVSEDDKPFSFSGLIPRLLKHIPAIIAMRLPITNAASLAFSTSVYPNIIELQIEEMIQRIRNSMYKNDNCNPLDFSIPVIFLASNDRSYQ